MTTESLQKQIDEQKITDRAIELFEAQSPHQLAVTLAHFEVKHAEAMSALDRMTGQRDQLAAQLKDATAPEGWQLVPVEPTAGMLKEGTWWLRNLSGLAKTYSAMLAAAPKPEGQ